MRIGKNDLVVMAEGFLKVMKESDIVIPADIKKRSAKIIFPYGDPKEDHISFGLTIGSNRSPNYTIDYNHRLFGKVIAVKFDDRANRTSISLKCADKIERYNNFMPADSYGNRIQNLEIPQSKIHVVKSELEILSLLGLPTS